MSTAAADRSRPLAGRLAWVTGSSRGIGRVVADPLASLGAVVEHGTSAHSTRAFDEAESLGAMAEAIAAAHGADVLPVFGDLSDEEHVAALLSAIHARSGASTSWSIARAATWARWA